MKKIYYVALITILIAVISVFGVYLTACKPNQETCDHDWESWRQTDEGYERTCKKCGYAEQLYNDIEVKNAEENKRLIAEMQEKMSAFSNEAEQADNLTYNIKIEYDGDEMEQSFKYSASPLYIEIASSQSNGEPIVIREENGRVFSYVDRNYGLHGKRNVQKTFLGNIGDELEIPDVENEVIWNDELYFNSEKCNVSCKNGVYSVEILFKDLTQSDMLSEVKELFEHLDLDPKALDYAVIELEISATDTVAKVKCDITLKTYVNDEVLSLAVTTVQTVDLSEFQQFVYSEEEYHILNPAKIDDVFDYTDITKPIQCDADYNVFKVHLTTGQYALDTKESNFFPFFTASIRPVENPEEYFSFGIYATEPYVAGRYGKTFVIDAEGDYYLSIRTEYFGSYEYPYYLEKLDYETTFDVTNPEVLTTSTSGEIEGKLDLNCYEYVEENESLITVTNTGSAAINLIYKENYGIDPSPYMNELNPNESAYILARKGSNLIFVGMSAAGSYAIETSVYRNDNGASENVDEMPTVTNQWSDDYFMAGYGFADKYVKVNATKKGIYVLESQSLNDRCSDFNFELYENQEVEDRNYLMVNKLVVSTPGEYIIQLTNNTAYFSIAKIRYVFIDGEDKDVDVTLSKASYDDAQSIYVENQNVMDGQLVRYHFTLEEKSYVLFDSDYLTVYDCDNVQLSFGSKKTQSLGIIALSAGDYYFATTRSYYNLHIAIITDFHGDSSIEYGNMKELTVNNSLTFTSDYDFDIDYAVIRITEKGRYEFNTYLTAVFDADLNEINTSEGYWRYDLDVGVYYVCLRHDYSMQVGGVTTLSIRKV